MTDKLSAEELKRLLHYDPDTGVFTWLKHCNNLVKKGSRAGGPAFEGYINIRINGLRFRAHRLAFLFMTGEVPAIIDHINGDRTDNRFCNLRAATRFINNANRKRPINNSSGFKGVSLVKASGRWQAAIRVKTKRIHLGLFETAEEAGAAYRAAAIEHFGPYARFE